MENKTCKQCQQQFLVEDDDLAFYKKISPTFAGKTFEMPSPTLCSECRRQRRIACRNMTKLYKRKSDLSGKEIISPYAPNSGNKIYDTDEYHSDRWNPLDFGRDYDFTKPFFEQFNELYLDVPLLSRNVLREENSAFTNNATGLKNCYLIQGSNYSEDCYYGFRVDDSRDCVDNYICRNSEKCYEGINIENCYNCLFCNDSVNCRDSILLDNCASCKDCYGCSNLHNKQYFVNNELSNRDEVEKLKKEFLKADLEKRKSLVEKERQFFISQPKRFAHILKGENATGDYISNSKDISESFMINESENLKYCYNVIQSKDSMDYDIWGNNSRLIYECDEVGENLQNVFFSRMIEESSNIFYSIGIYANCHNCFGCAGLKHAEYCIFNKQFSKEDYETEVAKIIENMKRAGEWGEFFPISQSPYGYNESLAQDIRPLTKEGAQKIGARWQDQDFYPDYRGEFYKPSAISEYESNQQKVDQALSGVLKCEISGKPFKLQAGELAFYIKNNIQIPNLHPDQRHINRSNHMNPLKIWHRQCMCEESGHGHEERCQNEFETTYAPNRPEKVYCEKCYQQSVT